MRLLILFFISVSMLWANTIAGVYAIQADDDESYIEVFEKDSKFYAIGFANKSGKKAGKDVKNPNPKLREKRVGENVFLWGLQHKEDNKYEGGKLYNYRDGRTYYVSVTRLDNALQLRVSKDKKGTFGKTLTWKKMTNKEIAPYQSKRPNIATLELPSID